MKKTIKLIFFIFFIINLSGCFSSVEENEKLTSVFNEKWKEKLLKYNLKNLKLCTDISNIGLLGSSYHTHMINDDYCFLSNEKIYRVYLNKIEYNDIKNIKIKYSEDSNEFKISIHPETKEILYFDNVLSKLSESAKKIIEKEEKKKMIEESWNI